MNIKIRNNLHYYSKGEGKPLYLIHGFPDCPENFQYQIDFFSEKGFKVIAPFLPGYHKEDQELDTYQSLRVSERLIEFIEEESNGERIYLFGHDWGAPISYGIAQLRPDLIHKFSTASVPYGQSVQASFLTNGDQQRKSWYMFFFQLPIAEIAVAMNEYEFINRLWKEWSPDLKDYKDYSEKVINVLKEEGVLSKALSYYRCTFQESLQIERINKKSIELLSTQIQPPCLYFHGKNDGCISSELTAGMEDHFLDLEMKILDNCGHFLHLEKKNEFNEILLSFFTDTFSSCK